MYRSNCYRAHLRIAAISVALVVFGTNAAAQEVQLQEVVVTAERRSENIQNVPIAVTAFSAETLASRNLTDVHSIGNLTPGVNLDAGAPFSADRSVLSASIRGDRKSVV